MLSIPPRKQERKRSSKGGKGLVTKGIVPTQERITL